MSWHDRITIDPKVLSGKPVISGTRIGVAFLLGLFAKGWSNTQVLENYPQLTEQDLLAVFAYTAARFDDETFEFDSSTRAD